jgi:hypothetical protein
VEGRSSLFLPNPLWPNAVEHKNRVGKWKKRGTVDQKSRCFLGIVRVKVPLVGDPIERSEDFLFVPLRARTRQLFFVFCLHFFTRRL